MHFPRTPVPGWSLSVLFTLLSFFQLRFENQSGQIAEDQRGGNSRRRGFQSAGEQAQKALRVHGLFYPVKSRWPNPISGTVTPAPA